MTIELIEQNDNYELVKVGNQKYCYQINTNKDLNSSSWWCFGAWATLEEAQEVFNKKYS